MSGPVPPTRPRIPLFITGHILATPGALLVLQRAGVQPMTLLTRHVFGDGGQLCDEDREANRHAVAHGGRVFSSYWVGTGAKEERVWIITEADRSSTTILRPEEY